MSASSRISRSSEFYGDSRVSGWTRLLVLWILLILPSWRTVALRKKYIDKPIPHSNIYDRWVVDLQLDFTKYFVCLSAFTLLFNIFAFKNLQKIVLWNICGAVITSTLVRSREFRATPTKMTSTFVHSIDKKN